MTPGSLDPATVRLARKLHELVEAIDATEHAASLLSGGSLRGQTLTDLYDFRARMVYTQHQLEHMAAGT